ncbi:arginase family protein, partial [Klebsiella pneumoniae]
AIGCGAQDDGCKDGPRALLEAGALGRLQTRDTHAALVHDIELAMSAGHSRSARLAALPGVAGFSRALGDATAHSVHQGHVPVVIGGDHSCAIGTWSGVANALRPRGPLGLIWIDAHLDSHTPQTSDSGAIHGMPLAALLG